MTQAFNLAQLANKVNSSGQLDASTGLANATPVANGGTGAATLTANNVLLGNGTSAVQLVAPGAIGNALVSNGTTWTSSSVPAVTSFIGQTGAVNPTTLGNLGSIVQGYYIVTSPTTGGNSAAANKYATGLSVAGSSIAYDFAFTTMINGVSVPIYAGSGFLRQTNNVSTSSFTFPVSGTAIGGNKRLGTGIEGESAVNPTATYSILSGSWKSLVGFSVHGENSACVIFGAFWPLVSWVRYA